MKILMIANNINGNADGIGKHSRLVAEELIKQGAKVDFSTGETWNMSKRKLFISLVMCKAYAKTICKVIRKDYDYVNIEYPFMEYNPLIVILHVLLWIVTRFTKTKISFSMHEHDRVKPLRRLIIDFLLPFSDIIFVSEKKYFRSLKQYAKRMYLRTIFPNGIKYFANKKDFGLHNTYCYFGLINSSKAFQQMLDAWSEFNKDNKYHLDIVTRSDLSTWNIEKNLGVTVHHNLSDDESGVILSKSVFSIVPVLPSIGYNNSTFISATQCGCISIGHFCFDLQKLPFIINSEDYSLQHFVEALQKSKEIKNLQQISNMAIEFGSNFSAQKTASMMIEGFNAGLVKRK